MDNRLGRFCLLASFVLPLGVYFYTAAPGPFWEDSATFSMAAATLSIPHSPSFPLWVLIGKLFSWLIPSNPARATNMMCGFFGAVGAALFYLCTRKVLTNIFASPVQSSPAEGAGSPVFPSAYPAAVTLTAFGAALVFAFSQTVWLQAVRAEVYSLQLVLTLSALLVALSLDVTERPTQYFLVAAFLWGLSLAVHPLLSASVLPGLLIAGAFRSAGWKKELAKWGLALVLVLLAFTVYAYLPVRSAQEPYFNWNQPDNWERFKAAVTRSGSWAASISDTPTHVSYSNSFRLMMFLFSEYSPVFWIFALVGAVRLAHYLPKAGLGIFVMLLSNLFVTLWAAEFSPWNMDLLGYLSFGCTLAVLAAAVALFEFLLWTARRVGPLSTLARRAAPVALAALAFFLAGKNWARADLHNSFWPQKVAKESLEALPPNAVVIYSSDRLLTSALYQQGALGQRPDVAVLLINIFADSLLREQVLRRHPDLVIAPIPKEGTQRGAIRKGFYDFCHQNKRPVFSQLGFHMGQSRNFWPAGYLLEYRPELAGPEIARPIIEFVDKTFTGKPDFLSRESIGLEIYNWGAYLSKVGAGEQEDLFSRAAAYDGENPRTWTTLGKAHLFNRRFPLAETCFKLALSYDPYQGENYMFLAEALHQQGKSEEAKEARAEGAWLLPDKLKPMGREDEKTRR
jgi:tetratricopeptide (TPR) repeat protein